MSVSLMAQRKLQRTWLRLQQVLSHEPENEITLTAYRLLTMDLLTLFHVMNEGTINVLGKKVGCVQRGGWLMLEERALL